MKVFLYFCCSCKLLHIHVCGFTSWGFFLQFQGAHNRMQWLLETYIFSAEDLDLNSEVLMWPRNINPVFDANDDVSDDLFKD